MTVGIIAEYNPFHNGHLYQINKVKEMFKEATIIVVLSGNFTQRGDVSIIDKWKKTEIALNNNVDLVVELPFIFATQSADYFAYGAITILHNLKVDYLVFGSELNNINDLEEIVNCQLNHPEFNNLVKLYCKLGFNYPTSLSKALKDLTNKTIKTPNDLLGISYLKTIRKYNYNIKPITIKRTNNYHEQTITSNISSATAIRKAIKNNLEFKTAIPENSITYYEDLHFIDDYFEVLKYKIIIENNLDKYLSVEANYNKKLKKYILTSNNINELILNIKSKKDTYNKISRMLLHILLNITKEENKKLKEITYIRILGFNNNGQNYLKKIKKDINIPIISKINKQKDKMLELEIKTSKIYYLKSKDYIELIKRDFTKLIIKK